MGNFTDRTCIANPLNYSFYFLHSIAEVIMTKKTAVDLASLNVDELMAITQNAQQLIVEKQHQRLYDAFEKFEEIAESCNSTIDEILKAGEQLEKKRSIKYRNPNNSEETWTGRGRKPTWLVTALDNGQALEDFAI